MRSRLEAHTTRNLDRGRGLGAWRLALAVGVVALLACWAAGPVSAAAPPPARIAHGGGEIVALPASIPHEDGDMVDSRIIPSLRWIAQRFPIYITDGYSGRLPGGGEQVGCRGCHVSGSDHLNGLAVDIVPLSGSSSCDASWRPITRLAHLAEPRQNRPRAPFRWVGYDGDANHGCGNHLHLSWEHAATDSFQLAEWVEVFAVNFAGPAGQQRPNRKDKPKPPPAPSGGASAIRAGGLSPHGD